MKYVYWVIMGLLIAACGQNANSSSETASESVVEVANQNTFEKQVFLFADTFNTQMQTAKVPLSITGSGIKDEILQIGNSKVSAITPNLSVNWLPNASHTDIDMMLIMHKVHNAPQDEFAAINVLLITQSQMTQTEIERFYAVFTEYMKRLMEIRKLDKPSDTTKIEFIFSGYQWELGMDNQYTYYLRKKM